MENQTKISVSYTENYCSYSTSVGNNLKHVQITTKYRYKVLNQEKLKTFCKVAIEEVCKKHKIKIVIIRVLEEHVHMIVDCPRIISDSELVQLIKGFSSRILFLLYEPFRDMYPKRHFWNEGYFCCSVGSDFDRTFAYVLNQ